MSRQRLGRGSSAIVQFRIDPEILAEIDRACERRGQTRSEVIRDAVMAWYRKARAFERIKTKG